ncbi:hypothetical protein [Rossellomorea marisflavi]|uniref:hypothetical protein n=1 Tax=Rossellomorea marisflavi TaxID=189381 RepID=UPI001EE35D8C|nr:hypothetical protein [Rossellomorea marisflavi]UKS65251.1 hypothetical protein K6T23_21465 [Rossellomorea marisflavi]
MATYVNGGVLSWLMPAIAWGILIIGAVFMIRRQKNQAPFWKAFLVFMVGVFTISYTFEPRGIMVRIPILPLGVLILYLTLRRKNGRWERYRRFAWFGFAGNILLAIMALAAIPLSAIVYPSDDPATYLSNPEKVSLVQSHPAASNVSLDQKKLAEQLDGMTEAQPEGESWYRESTVEDENQSKAPERFPYLLSGVEPKWGSGLSSLIYVEGNGKGLLILSGDTQYYYQLSESIIKGGGAE